MAVTSSSAWLSITTNPSQKEALQRLAPLDSLIISPQEISCTLSEATSKELPNCVWPCCCGGATANFIVKLIGSADASSMGLCTLMTVKYLPGASVFPTGWPQTNFARYSMGSTATPPVTRSVETSKFDVPSGLFPVLLDVSAQAG